MFKVLCNEHVLVVVDAGLTGDSRGLSRSRDGPGALRSLLRGRPSKGDAIADACIMT